MRKMSKERNKRKEGGWSKGRGSTETDGNKGYT